MVDSVHSTVVVLQYPMVVIFTSQLVDIVSLVASVVLPPLLFTQCDTQLNSTLIIITIQI